MADGSASAFGRDSAASETRDRVAAMNGSPHIAVCPPAPSHMQDKFGLPEKAEDSFSSSGAAPSNRPNYLESVSNSDPSISKAQARDLVADKDSRLDTAPSTASPGLSGRPGLPDKPSQGPLDRSVSPASSLGRTGTGTGTGTGSKVESSKEETRSPAIAHESPRMAGLPSSQGALGLPEKPPVSKTSDGPGLSGYSPKSGGADSKTTSETAAPDAQDGGGPSSMDGPPFLAICPPAPPGYRGMGMSNSDSGPDKNLASGGDGPAANASKSAEGMERSESSAAGLERAPATGGPPRVAVCPPAPPGHEAKWNDSFGSGPSSSDGADSKPRVEKPSEGGAGTKSPLKMEGALVGGAAASGTREGMNSAPSRASPFGEPALPSPAASVSKSDVASESAAGDRNVASAHNGQGKTEASAAPATHTGPAVQSVPAPAPAPNMSAAGTMVNSEAGRGEGSTGDAGSGQKRKIEEYAAPANVTTPLTADQAESQITPPEKKAKVDEAPVGTDEGSPASKATKAKRKKKAPPVVGTSTRKTRSQGPAEL